MVFRAALDSKSEKVVVNALKLAMKRTRCMIMITQLLKSDGMYSQLAREQGILPLQGSKAGNENITAPYL